MAEVDLKNLELASGWQASDVETEGPVIEHSFSQVNGELVLNLGTGSSYGDMLAWLTPGNRAGLAYFRMSCEFLIAQPERSQALEFAVNYVGSDFSWYKWEAQAAFADGFWRTWASDHWQATTTPVQRPAPGVWHTLSIEGSVTQHQALVAQFVYDGKVIPVNGSFAPVPRPTFQAGNFGMHLQLDGLGTPQPYSVRYRNIGYQASAQPLGAAASPPVITPPPPTPVELPPGRLRRLSGTEGVFAAVATNFTGLVTQTLGAAGTNQDGFDAMFLAPALSIAGDIADVTSDALVFDAIGFSPGEFAGAYLFELGGQIDNLIAGGNEILNALGNETGV